MGRSHVVMNAKTGEVTVVAFTPQEEAEADAVVVRETPRDPLAEIEELKAALIEKGVIAASDIVESKVTDG